ncbi:MAG TPA: sigma-70 family RNA polymerase sigma factor [Polyangiaceae bacterium]
MSDDDRDLVTRLRAGQPSAIEELYEEYRKPIFGFLARLARDRPLAEDLFQNTWLKVSRSAHRIREDTELKAWLFTVARNEFRSYRRWQMIDLSSLLSVGAHRAETTCECDELAGLERALGELGASDREVLLLVSVEGLAPQQAAAVLGISHAALRQRLARARARLKSALSKLERTTGVLRPRIAREP